MACFRRPQRSRRRNYQIFTRSAGSPDSACLPAASRRSSRARAVQSRQMCRRICRSGRTIISTAAATRPGSRRRRRKLANGSPHGSVRAFVDTGALLALSHSRDQYHARAVSLARHHHASGSRYVSSLLVLSEFHSHLLYVDGPARARAAVSALLDDPAQEWRAVTPDLVREARDSWLARFPDQRLSLTDAVSFAIMAREKLTRAFAFDTHFEIAGFELLR